MFVASNEWVSMVMSLLQFSSRYIALLEVSLTFQAARVEESGVPHEKRMMRRRWKKDVQIRGRESAKGRS